MKIGIHSPVSDRTYYPNLALMKISSYWKSKGAKVEWYDALFNHSDAVYSSKIFDFSGEDLYLPKDTIKGGTGYDIKSKLPDEIEICDPDYSIYPFCDFSIQLFSRGCIRKCSFCVVPDKEGKIRAVKPMKLNPKGSYIRVFDNNFFSAPQWRGAVKYLLEQKQPVFFENGFDARLFKEKHAVELLKLRHGIYREKLNRGINSREYLWKQYRFAWDNANDDLQPKLKEITKWFKPGKLMCYVLIGYDSTPEQDIYRIEKLREIGIDPFVMPFNKADRYQMKIARWVNRKAIFKSVAWSDYSG